MFSKVIELQLNVIYNIPITSVIFSDLLLRFFAFKNYHKIYI